MDTYRFPFYWLCLYLFRILLFMFVKQDITKQLQNLTKYGSFKTFDASKNMYVRLNSID